MATTTSTKSVNLNDPAARTIRISDVLRDLYLNHDGELPESPFHNISKLRTVGENFERLVVLLDYWIAVEFLPLSSTRVIGGVHRTLRRAGFAVSLDDLTNEVRAALSEVQS